MEKFYSNSGDEFVILSKIGKKCVIQFTATGSIRQALYDNIVAGKVKDLYKTTRYGVGYLGDFDKSKPYWKQAKQLWSNMLKRCYCESDDRGYFGKGVEVDTRWKCFANFLDDLASLENFDQWLSGFNSNDKYNLDKDLLVEGCKVYSVHTCWFVPEGINKAAGARNGKPYTKNPKVGKV